MNLGLYVSITWGKICAVVLFVWWMTCMLNCVVSRPMDS